MNRQSSKRSLRMQRWRRRLPMASATITFILLAAAAAAVAAAAGIANSSSHQLLEAAAAPGGAGFSCSFGNFEAMSACGGKNFNSCCSAVESALYAGCLCSNVFQLYVRDCVVVSRELSDYLSNKCIPQQRRIQRVECYRNLTYHDPQDASDLSICPIPISSSPPPPPPPLPRRRKRMTPLQWFCNTSQTLPPPVAPSPLPTANPPLSPSRAPPAPLPRNTYYPSSAGAAAASSSVALLVLLKACIEILELAF